MRSGHLAKVQPMHMASGIELVALRSDAEDLPMANLAFPLFLRDECHLTMHLFPGSGG